MSLPQKITLYCKHPDEEGVHHAFPVDAEASHDTARYWASEPVTQWNPETRRRETIKQNDPIIFEFDNSGFDDVTIVELYHRGNGGRAYQVVIIRDGHKFRVDFREDALMDVIENTGIQAGGKLNGSFAFIKKGSQTNLVREGSEEHQYAISQTVKKNSGIIKKEDLKVGHAYEKMSGGKAIFGGFVYIRPYKKDTKTYGRPSKRLLFFEYSSYNEDRLKNLLEGEESNYASYNISCPTSHSYRQDLGRKYDISEERFLEIIKGYSKEGLQKYMSPEDIKYFDVDTTRTLYSLSLASADKNVEKDESVEEEIDKLKESKIRARARAGMYWS